MREAAGKLARGSVLRVLNLGAATLVSLLLMPYVVHKLGDEAYGIWALMATFVGYSALLELGLSPAVSRFLGRSLGKQDWSECNQVFSTALGIYSLVGLAALLLAGTAAGLIAQLQWAGEYSSEVSKLTVILGLSLAIGFPTRVLRAVLDTSFEFGLTATIDMISLGVRATFTVGALSLGYGLVGLGWATFFAGVPASVIYFHAVARKLQRLRIGFGSWSFSTAKELFSYSAYSFISSLARILRFQLDGFVVAAFVGLAPVTHYKVASTIVLYFSNFMSALMGVFPPVFSRLDASGDHAAIRKTLVLATKIAIIIAAFVGFGLIAWGRPFIARWMGEAYLDAYPVLVILVIAQLATVSQGPSVSLLFGTAKHKFVAFSDSAEGLANLALSIALAPRYGMVGIALGTMVPMLVSKLIVQPIYVCKVAGIPYAEYVRGIARTTSVIVMGLALPLLISMRFAAPDYLILIAVGLVSGICYLLLLWSFAFRATEAQLLRHAFLPTLAVRKSR